MKFNELTAERLMQSLALIGEAAEHVMQGGIGEDLVKEIAAYRSKPKAKGTKQADAFGWAAGLVSKCIPRMLKENVGDLYKVLRNTRRAATRRRSFPTWRRSRRRSPRTASFASCSRVF